MLRPTARPTATGHVLATENYETTPKQLDKTGVGLVLAAGKPPP